MNCTINTLSPCPTARKAVPSAAVVLPFPGPVLTMISPFLFSGKLASLIALPRIGVAAQKGKASIKLLEEQGARPVAGKGQSRERQEKICLFPEGCRESVAPTYNEREFACTV